jgi:hypothetical protein
VADWGLPTIVDNRQIGRNLASVQLSVQHAKVHKPASKGPKRPKHNVLQVGFIFGGAGGDRTVKTQDSKKLLRRDL